MASSTTETHHTLRYEASTRQRRRKRERINVGRVERILSALGGGSLVAYGLFRRDWMGVTIAAVGGALATRGITGQSFLYHGLHWDTSKRDTHNATSVPHHRGVKVVRAVTVQKAPEELYRFWRSFENLPHIMQHLQSVTVKDNTHSHWIAKSPAGHTVAWDAVIINDKENELIAWRSVESADIDNAGSVHFTPAPGGRGTVVRVVLEYNPPAGKAGALVAKLFGEEPDIQVREDLRRFKEMMEAGEVPTTEGQPSGRRK